MYDTSSSTPPPVDEASDAQATDPEAVTESAGAARRRMWRKQLVDAVTWTPPQRRAMAAVLCVVLALLAWRALANRAHVTDPQPSKPIRYAELADRLDPNVASWQELVAIPQLGESRARAIVAYRDDWLSRHPGERTFKAPIDLVVVRGIGTSMLELISPHLMFPGDPTTKQR